MFDHCLYFNTAALARRLDREWTTAFKPFGLTAPQGFLLRAVLASPGQLLSALAETLGISRPTATRAVDALELRGLVKRSGCDGDGRQTAVWPTAEAEALGGQLEQASAAVTRRLKAQLGESSFVETVARVRGVRNALE